jgi:hypothetical protein
MLIYCGKDFEGIGLTNDKKMQEKATYPILCLSKLI